jgi:Arc/MetJ family transcription regulator
VGQTALARLEANWLCREDVSGISETRQPCSIVTILVREAVLILVHGGKMRATVSLDDELLRTAEEYTGLTERAALIRAALKSLIAREAGRRLLALAGTAPNMEDVRRLRVDEQ